MSKSDIIKNRAEIVFFYDVRDNNPNGDPLAENKPRMDEETGTGIVTDVRLKRTIRDYLRDYENKIILIDRVQKDDGTIKMARERAQDIIKENNEASVADLFIENCIDARLFGCAIPLGEKKKGIQLTGPVQFNYGRSVHKIEPILLKGTGAFASKMGNLARTFRYDYIIYYGLYRFYGIINEKLGEITKLTKSDINLLMKSLWRGTERLQSRSKVGHSPRLLFKLEYNEPEFFIGQIDKLIIASKKDQLMDDLALRDISEFIFDIGPLEQRITTNIDKISSVSIKADPCLKFKGYENITAIIKNWKKKKIPIEDLKF